MTEHYRIEGTEGSLAEYPQRLMKDSCLKIERSDCDTVVDKFSFEKEKYQIQIW